MEIDSIKNRFGIVGNSPALNRAVERAVKVAPVDLSVLVYGPSGSGKEFFPQIIHAYGNRKHKKYIAVNCGAIPEGTIDSELFGHEKGSFTGAVSSRKGYFEEADGGTIFLDEVAELPLTTQARLLRVLETGEYLKVGSSQVQKTDIRVVAATNVDLLEAVREGRFREDLYYRLSTVVINVPPLADRGSDVLLLARKFLSDFAEKYMTSPVILTDDARRVLEIYPWPGNVRQLKNIIDQLALFHPGEEISRHTLLDLLPSPQSPNHPANSSLLTLNSSLSTLNSPQDPWPYIAALLKEVEALKSRVAALEAARRPDNPLRNPLLLESLSTGNEEEPPGASTHESASTHEGAPATSPGGNSLQEAERTVIERAMREANGDKKLAASRLGISTRTLYRKLHEYSLL